MRILSACLLAMMTVALLGPVPARAVAPDEVLSDPVLEQRARDLSADLRCLVCQNQSIDDSDAPLAKDLRILVRERLVAGDSNGEVIDFLVSRYGEFVLLKPRFSMHTLLLWTIAPVMLLIGAFVLVMKARRRTVAGTVGEPTGLSAEEQAALDRLLDKGADGK